MKQILIIGAGGHGREIAQLVRDINRKSNSWELLGYLDENKSLTNQWLNGFPVLGTLDLLQLELYRSVYVICAIGKVQVRKKLVNHLKNKFSWVKFATLIHPTAVVGDEIVIGEGSVICANSVVTTNVTLGQHVLINYGCTIGHDSLLEDFATILPGSNLSGNVTIRTCVEVGTGTAIIPGVEIKANTIVGAGAVVTRSLPADCTAVGVPAKVMKFQGPACVEGD
ncbi:sugar O-acyltransferase (sialic acid O-acetyltransferase NeuD family) [Aneurinibacillus soli]|uniref:Putative acetyltransferase EpsM n=1 Tax=Aneurinibacillus soli TaxID=1500254 RepID=A0A0U5B3Y7_9BACL|nr:acetyltransferase [Aneurinibacillus soli]PYE64146.1 sugar O-acyltransferase (sialic acid O-acetyltransferase NeuD family) [Aneurinibacillus soli]BAU28095.1 putative acetyltransferase EpsM [Aneurinibacillus soli]